MNNFCTDQDKIQEAFEKGIITPEDFAKWNGLNGYKKTLKKSVDNDEITKSTFATENAKADGFYFQRDRTSNTLKFRLYGSDFQPLDLFPKPIIKARQEQPLQRSQAGSLTDSTKRMMASADNLLTSTNELKRMVEESNRKMRIKK